MAESILTRPSAKKAWSPKIGGNDRGWLSGALSNRYGIEHARFCLLEPRPQFTCGVARVVTSTFTVGYLTETLATHITPNYRMAYKYDYVLLKSHCNVQAASVQHVLVTGA